jgi:hypothetical protein
MNYSEAKQKLNKLFESKNYQSLIQKGWHHQYQDLIETCANGSQIYISYPGLKARVKNNKEIVYDYRVDMVTSHIKTSLSHANIIVDIYNKCFHGFNRELMKKLLIRSAKEGQFNLDIYPEIKRYPYHAVDSSILQYSTDAHKALGKTYNSSANQFDLTFEELLKSIFWIVIQEDINYPMPRYQGRKMPFSRYLETLHCFEGSHTLNEVIHRALLEGEVPKDWHGMDYSFRSLIHS